jgi:HPt (histidine-containing phosphotransfer) domain-containing protein
MSGVDAVLDISSLRSLADELECEATALRFVSDFLHQLPARVVRIKDALETNDREYARDAVLSLACSASMIGAQQLERYTRIISSQVQAGDFRAAQLASLDLDRSTADVAEAIIGILSHEGPGSIRQTPGDQSRPVLAGTTAS